MTPATSLSPRTQTRQQLDELDALLQKMLALPASFSEAPLPVPEVAAPPLSPSPIPGYLTGISTPFAPPTFAQTFEDAPARPRAIEFAGAGVSPRASDPAIAVVPAFASVVPAFASVAVVSLPPEPARIGIVFPSMPRESLIPQGVRMLLGRVGVSMLLASAVWAVGERLGWDWTFSG